MKFDNQYLSAIEPGEAMPWLIIFVMGFGLIVAIIGILLFSKKGSEGSNNIKMFGFEFQLAGSSLVIFVIGALIFLAPILYSKGFNELVYSPRSEGASSAQAPVPQQTPTVAPKDQVIPHAPPIEVDSNWLVWEERLTQFELNPGEEKVLKGMELYTLAATYPTTSCSGPGMVPYTWQIRKPYPDEGELGITRILQGGKTEQVGRGSSGRVMMGWCEEHTFRNNGLESIFVEVRYASAAHPTR